MRKGKEEEEEGGLRQGGGDRTGFKPLSIDRTELKPC
jgi:hypothetical protein